MVTITTKRGKQVNLLTTGEWWERICGKYGEKITGRLDGLVALEQAMFQSEANKVCVECLGTENLQHITRRALIKSTDYYMCQECLDYYENKG